MTPPGPPEADTSGPDSQGRVSKQFGNPLSHCLALVFERKLECEVGKTWAQTLRKQKVQPLNKAARHASLPTRSIASSDRRAVGVEAEWAVRQRSRRNKLEVSPCSDGLKSSK